MLQPVYSALCQVASGTTKDAVSCLCTHLTSFGSGLLVAPNPIDFDSVFANFGSPADNAAVLVLIFTILGLYILGILWARRADKHDKQMVCKNRNDYAQLYSSHWPKPRTTLPFLFIRSDQPSLIVAKDPISTLLPCTREKDTKPGLLQELF